MGQTSKRERTQARLAECAVRLFEKQGFAATSVAQIAEAAGVTEMTFFRHFGAKEAVITTDPYDPVVATGIHHRPRNEKPLTRAVRGLRSAFGGISEPEVDILRRRVRIIARTPELRAAVAQQNQETEQAIWGQLIADGAVEFEARIAAAAVMATLTAALYEWAEHETRTIATTFEQALQILEEQRD